MGNPSLIYLGGKVHDLFHAFKPDNDVKIAIAAAAGEVRVCERLLEMGADPLPGRYTDMREGGLCGPLDAAIMSGSPKLVRLIFESGSRGRTILKGRVHANLQKRALEYASSDQDARLSALFEAEILKIGLQAKEESEVHAWGSFEFPGTPLNHHEIAEVAAQMRSKKVLRRMIQNGFTLKDTSAKLEGHFFMAAATDDAEFCEVLLDIGVRIDAVTGAGATALGIAAGQGFTRVCGC